MTNEITRNEIIDKIGKVMAIPAIAARAVILLNDQNKNLSEAIALIEYDPGLTANILRLVNSSSFASEHKISSLTEAVTRVGANNVLQMLLCSSIAGMMNQPVRGYDLPPGELWKSAVTGAILSDQIRQTLSLNLPDHTFTAALLRDVGKMVMGSFIEINAEEILSYAAAKNISFPEAERDILGIDHTEVGGLLLEKWNFPVALRNPVRWHHDPEKCLDPLDRQVAEVVHVADAMTMICGEGTGYEGLRYKLSDEVVAKLNLTVNIVESIICKMQTQRELVSAYFINKS